VKIIENKIVKIYIQGGAGVPVYAGASSVIGRKGTPFSTFNLWLKAFLHIRLLQY